MGGRPTGGLRRSLKDCRENGVRRKSFYRQRASHFTISKTLGRLTFLFLCYTQDPAKSQLPKGGTVGHNI